MGGGAAGGREGGPTDGGMGAQEAVMSGLFGFVRGAPEARLGTKQIYIHIRVSGASIENERVAVCVVGHSDRERDLASSERYFVLNRILPTSNR